MYTASGSGMNYSPGTLLITGSRKNTSGTNTSKLSRAAPPTLVIRRNVNDVEYVDGMEYGA
jgi:hypothetical protein